MGNSVSLQDNQEVSHQSGASRLMNSVCAAVCVAPILLLLMVVMLGWNEQHAVCSAKAISAGEDLVEQMGCSNALEYNRELVMMNCDIQKTGLKPLSSTGDFASLQYVGTGLRVQAEMLQCVEHKKTETKKDKGGGGGSTTITTYTYSREWSSSEISSSSFRMKSSQNFQQNCGVENPRWPSAVPRASTTYQPNIKVGAVFTSLASSVPLNTPVQVAAPAGWSSSGYQFQSGKWSVGSQGIGSVRVAFYGNDWTRPAATLLGKNLNGVIGRWVAPSSWLCSGATLLDLRMGTWSKEALFKQMADENTAMTWILRIVGFALMWLAFSLMFGPLGVVADCIPCVGPFLGDSIEAATCCISCLPATACCSLIVGIVWVAMRPLAGIPLIMVFFVVLAIFVDNKRRNSKRQARLVDMNPHYGTAQMTAPLGINPVPVAAPVQPMQVYAPPAYAPQAQAPQAPAAVAAPAAAPQAPVAPAAAAAAPQVAVAVAMPVQPVRQFQVQVPAGCGPGSAVQVTSPEGTLLQVTIPEGCGEGSIFMATY